MGMLAPEGLFRELITRYAEPHRAYHTLQHLRECFLVLQQAACVAEHLAEVELAIWFHDAIYDTRSHENEERSAQWARASLVATGVRSESVERIQALILATKHQATPAGADACLVVDVDLSILGAEVDRFREYERQIREEYAWVSEPAFREGRARVLAGFLERSSIYNTAWFANRLEARARANSLRSLRELAGNADDDRVGAVEPHS